MNKGEQHQSKTPLIHASGFVNEGNNFNHNGVDADADADADPHPDAGAIAG